MWLATSGGKNNLIVSLLLTGKKKCVYKKALNAIRNLLDPNHGQPGATRIKQSTKQIAHANHIPTSNAISEHAEPDCTSTLWVVLGNSHQDQ